MKRSEISKGRNASKKVGTTVLGLTEGRLLNTQKRRTDIRMYKTTDDNLFYTKLLSNYKIANSQNIPLDIKP